VGKEGPAERLYRERAQETRKQFVTCPKHRVIQNQTFTNDEALFILQHAIALDICRDCYNRLNPEEV
jgi:hypothetical protein